MITYPNLGNSGRLGNQLFQIASTLGIADRFQDTASFPPWVYQPYFAMPSTYFDSYPGTPTDQLTITEHMPPEARPYLQDYRFFQKIEAQIRQFFQPSQHAMGLLLQDARIQELLKLPRPICAVHVRRGDNVYEDGIDIRSWKASYHPLRTTRYYQNSLGWQWKKYEFETVAVFSDDIEWCKDSGIFKHMKAWYFEDGVARPKEHEPDYATAPVLDWIDFFAMTMCDHHVISNSTYAWWAAFVSNSPSPIYNRPWFGPALSMIDEAAMFPSHWTCNYVDRPY